MSDTVQLGWRVPADVWEQFEKRARENRGSQRRYVREAIEQAMREYLDEDGVLAEAEDLLREYTDLRGLSSSTDPDFGTNRFAGEETKKVSHRVDPGLKERFQVFADKYDAPSYGRALAYALDEYADGGRARRILDDVERLVTGGTTAGTTDGSVESPASTDADSGTKDDVVESDLSTDDMRGTNSGTTDAKTIIEIADEFADNSEVVPRKKLTAEIKTRIARPEDEPIVERYREAVVDQLGLVEHPHNDDVYLAETYREQATLWADLDKAERICLLRRWLVADAIEKRKRKQAWSYRDVIDIFEDNAGGGGPSHQYAYDLMEAAADEDGFKYGAFSRGNETPRKQLRVDVSEVREEILEWCREEKNVDPSSVGVTADVTSYTAGPAPETEGVADD